MTMRHVSPCRASAAGASVGDTVFQDPNRNRVQDAGAQALVYVVTDAQTHLIDPLEPFLRPYFVWLVVEIRKPLHIPNSNFYHCFSYLCESARS
jgi:hypothetical protein